MYFKVYNMVNTSQFPRLLSRGPLAGPGPSDWSGGWLLSPNENKGGLGVGC